MISGPGTTGERLLRERLKIYRQVVRLLGEGWLSNKICKWCHVTREIRAVERREAEEVNRGALMPTISRAIKSETPWVRIPPLPPVPNFSQVNAP